MKVRFRKQVTDNGEFAELWNRISKRTKYRIELSSEKLVAECLKRISKEKRIQAAQVRVRTVALKQEKSGVTAGDTRRIQSFTTDGPVVLPDILAELQNETDLTRPTLTNILTGSERLGEFVSNPQQFIAMITMCIRSVLRTMMVEGISYHEVAGSNWEMHRLEGSASEDIERYINRLYKVQSAWKTPYDHIEIDSEVERKFAKELDSNDHVKHFVKLPRFFTVDTPIGPYNPDWAIVLDESVQNPATRVYLVRETKSTLETEKLRKAEATKVECAQKHFAAIDVNFGIATNLDDVFESLKPGAFG